MKTPREILLERHRDAGAKLDAMRRRVVEEMATPRTSAQVAPASGPSVATFIASLWQGLIWPSRRAWGTIVIIWAGVLVWNLAEVDATSPSAEPRSGEKSKVVQNLAAQRHLLSEMLEPAPQRPVEPSPANTKSRTDIVPQYKVC